MHNIFHGMMSCLVVVRCHLARIKDVACVTKHRQYYRIIHSFLPLSYKGFNLISNTFELLHTKITYNGYPNA